MTVADETIAYQALLEGARAYPDDHELAEDRDRALRALEVAWLDHTVKLARDAERWL